MYHSAEASVTRVSGHSPELSIEASVYSRSFNEADIQSKTKLDNTMLWASRLIRIAKSREKHSTSHSHRLVGRGIVSLALARWAEQTGKQHLAQLPRIKKQSPQNTSGSLWGLNEKFDAE